jgi:hypothetical protein
MLQNVPEFPEFACQNFRNPHLLDAGHAGVHNLLDVPAIRRLAGLSAVRSLIEPVLGPNCFAVLLWKEYGAMHPDGYRYSQFCYHYQQ